MPSIRRRVPLLLCGLLLLVAFDSGAAAQSQDPRIETRTLDPVVQPGGSVVVQVRVGTAATPVPRLSGIGFEIQYDEDALDFESHTDGALFESSLSSGQALEFTRSADPGKFNYSVTLLGGDALDNARGEVVRLRFSAAEGAAPGTYDVSLAETVRSTPDDPKVEITNVRNDDVEVSTTRSADRVPVDPGSVAEGSDEATSDGGRLALDFSSLQATGDARAVVVLTRSEDPDRRKGLPTVDGEPGEVATKNVWDLSQSGASSFTADVCFGLSDVAVSDFDPSALAVYTRENASSPWSRVSTALRPSPSNPEEVCATGVQGFSTFALLAPQGHARTVRGTDGTGNDAGWRLLALPTTADRATLEEDLSFSVGSGHLLYAWEGTQYTPVTSSGASLRRGRGFLLYFFDDSVDPITSSGLTLDLPATSEAQDADVSVPNLEASHPFHFLGNPFDVAFDLGRLSGPDGQTLPDAGFRATVQVWDPQPAPGRWVTKTQNTPSDEVAAWQGFFVERMATGRGATRLTFSKEGRREEEGDLVGSRSPPALAAGRGTSRAAKSRRTGSGADGARRGSPAEARPGASETGADSSARSRSVTDSRSAEVLVRLDLLGATGDTLSRDEATLFLSDRAASGYDAYEARDLPPPQADTFATASLPIRHAGEVAYRALAAMPYPEATGEVSATVPLSVRAVGRGGTAELSWPEQARARAPDGWTVRLVDRHTGAARDLRAGPYAFSLSSGDRAESPDDARFRVKVEPAAPLPVELARFEGTVLGSGPSAAGEPRVRLRWTTASEEANAGFRVQRRTGDAAAAPAPWTTVGRVDGAGTSSDAQRYRFVDDGLPYAADTLRYRLLQVDTDGSVNASDPIAVVRDGPDEARLLGTAPNPARTEARVRYAVPRDAGENARLVLYDLLGRRVRRVPVRTGRHARRLDVGSLPSGTYVLRLVTSADAASRRMTIVR